MKTMKNLTLLMLLVGGLFMFQGCKNPCKDVTCLNGGTCDEETGDCQCAAGYEGADCGVARSDRFKGTWTLSETCSPGGARDYPITFSAIQGNGDSLSITGLFLEQGAIKAIIEGDGSSFSIPKQKIPNTIYDVESQTGLISTDNSTLTLQYTITYVFDSVPWVNCTGTAVK